MQARSSAWTLALLFAVLVLYASLYPFGGWRMQGVSAWAFLLAPWPQYWTGFDLVSNLFGYAPLGFLLAVATIRSRWPLWKTWVIAGALPACFSLSIETVQNFLPNRVPSNVDLLLNTAGALMGATLAVLLWRLGAMRRWNRFRADWFRAQAHGGPVLLGLWLAALLYPTPVPFGLGQVAERLEEALTHLFAETPFLTWVPVRTAELVPLGTMAESFCVALCLLSPVWLGYADLRSAGRRAVFMVALLAFAFGVASLSATLTYGPAHAWAWVTTPATAGMAAAGLMGLLSLRLSGRLCHVLMLLSLALSLGMLNRVPSSPYFDQSLEIWERGRFIRFHGLSQWLGWLWPFVALGFGVRVLSRPAEPGGGA